MNNLNAKKKILIVGFGSIGFLDDILKLRRGNGISAKEKLFLQLLVSLSVGIDFTLSNGKPDQSESRDLDHEGGGGGEGGEQLLYRAWAGAARARCWPSQ